MVNNNNKTKSVKKSEIIFIVLILILSILVLVFLKFFNQSSNMIAEIKYKGDIVKTIDLSSASNHSFRLEENKNVGFEIKDNKISFVNVSCPDKVCEKFGFINTANSVAICLPNRTSVNIIGKGDLDAIAN